MEEAQAKRIFAEALLRNPGEPLTAGIAVFGMDMGSALRIATIWPQDEEVKRIQIELIDEHGIRHFLPSKDEFARHVYQFSQEIRDPDNRLKALRLAAEVMGYIEKPGVIVNNNVDNRRVMIVKDHGTDEQWEVKAAKSQQKLMTDAAQSEKERTIN